MFELWCEGNQADPLRCGAQVVLLFLQDELNKGKAYSTIRGMVAAIKAARVGGCRLSADCCSLISLFLKGARRLRSQARAPTVPPWDLGLVLGALGQAPFEPLESASLKWLYYKTAFLLAVTSARRVGELLSPTRLSETLTSFSCASSESAWGDHCPRLGCPTGLQK